MIEVTNLTKTYGKKESHFTALDDVSFKIKNGSRVAIVGKSGSGKSTLMHIMSGLDHPDAGHVSIDGVILKDMKQSERDTFRANEMSFIFQSFFVEPNQSCLQNVLLPLEIARVKPSIRTKKALAALAAVELSDKANNRARDLSGGQKQRLAIARAIVNEPKLIFADEPTGNLDTMTGDVIMKLLFKLNKEKSITLVIVTHDHELAAKCDSSIQLRDGKIVAAKKPPRMVSA